MQEGFDASGERDGAALTIPKTGRFLLLPN